MKKKKAEKRFFPKVYPRKIDWFDLVLIKFSTICVGFFLITVSQPIREFIFRIPWGVFLALAVLFSFRPLIKSEYIKE